MHIEGVKGLGIDLSEEQLKKFHLLLDELLEWNTKINLTSITAKDEIKTKHFLDSLMLAKTMDMRKFDTLLDIGSGAGFPGIPLKIAFPHINMTLVDSVKKKVDFMNHVIDALELKNIKAVFSRSEDLPKEMKGTFDIVISRAVAELRILSEYCLPYVKLSGFFVAYKGREVEGELKSAGKAISILGGRVENIMKMNLPNTDITRNLIIVKKVDRTPSNFPRRAGLAKKRPL